MFRILYVLAMAGLIGGVTWAAGGGDTQPRESAPGMGLVIIAALQR